MEDVAERVSSVQKLAEDYTRYSPYVDGTVYEMLINGLQLLKDNTESLCAMVVRQKENNDELVIKVKRLQEQMKQEEKQFEEEHDLMTAKLTDLLSKVVEQRNKDGN